MPQYRLYHFRPGHPARSDDLEAPDDVEAVRQSHWLIVAGPAELWCGERKVHAFNSPEVPS